MTGSGTRRTVVVCVVVCGVMLAGAWGLKSQCLAPWDGRQYAHLCYNDIQALYSSRGVEDNIFPYVHGRLSGGELTDGAIEYPVLTGLLMWAGGLLVSSPNAYLGASAALLVPFAVMSSYFLARMAGWRALMWSGAPALVFYAFHNWDLAAVAAVIGAVWAWQRGRPGWAGALLGVGGALKLYPLLFLPGLVMDAYLNRKRAGDSQKRLRPELSCSLACLGVWASLNLPFVVANPDGWLATWRFHAGRVADFNSIWAWVPGGLAPEALNSTTAGLSVLTAGIALAYGWRRAGVEGSFPFLQVSAAVLAAFLLWTKVHSPQYALWIMPFFVWLDLSPLWWLAYSAVDAVLYVGIFRWFFDSVYLGRDFTPAKQALIVGVWGRAALLAILVVIFSRSQATVTPQRSLGETTAGRVSHPSPRVAIESSART